MDYKRAIAIDPSLNLQGKIKENQTDVKKAKKKDFYKVLGVNKDATDKEIKKAFHKLSLQWHPDRHKDSEDKEEAERKYKEIVEAYDVLKDAKKRKQFDMGVYDDGTGGMGGGGAFNMDD